MAKSREFFCIRGYMKSGTNWMGRLLKLHPNVDCVGEFHWETLFHAMEQNLNHVAPQRRQSMNSVIRPELQAMVQRCLLSFADSRVTMIGDRTPTTIAPIVIADAPHIVLIRDFRDVIVSRMFHLYSRPQVTGIFHQFPELRERQQLFQNNPWCFREHPDLLLEPEPVIRDSAREWARFCASDRRTVAENKSLAVKFLKYERLHADCDNQLRELIQFLRLPATRLEIPSELQPGHETENPNLLNRKGQIGDWKNYMTKQARNWINDEAGQELVQQGYVETMDWF